MEEARGAIAHHVAHVAKRLGAGAERVVEALVYGREARVRGEGVALERRPRLREGEALLGEGEGLGGVTCERLLAPFHALALARVGAHAHGEGDDGFGLRFGGAWHVFCFWDWKRWSGGVLLWAF